MKEQIYRVKDNDFLVYMADLQRPPKGNVKTALLRWMESFAKVGEEYVVVRRLTEVYIAMKQERVMFEVAKVKEDKDG